MWNIERLQKMKARSQGNLLVVCCLSFLPLVLANAAEAQIPEQVYSVTTFPMSRTTQR